jgi:hypothetical protein
MLVVGLKTKVPALVEWWESHWEWDDGGASFLNNGG